MAESPADATPCLVELARRGDPAAMQELLVLCQPRLRRYAYVTCSQSRDVEDATQESLIVIYQRLGMLQFTAAFSRWAFQIVRRECLRLARHARWTRPVRAAAAEAPDYQLRIDIHHALESIPHIYREAVLLRDFGELPFKDIADRLGLPVNTIKVRVHRGRAMIREYLDR